ncbi:PP2C family protein-serine/threonine phosphatase [Treponema sp. R6D11]
MQITGFSNKGNRATNEDAIFCDEKQNLFVVADGMGGENGGEVASTACVTTIQMAVGKGKENIEEGLYKAIFEANEVVYSLAIGENKSMGTTVVVAKIADNNLYVASVGDSRAYILRNNQFRQITKDHTAVQELLDLGGITENEKDKHPSRGQLTKAIGTDKSVEADVYKVELERGDSVALMTDGIYNGITDVELGELMRQGQSAEAISNLAVSRYGKDNASIIVIYNI